MRPFRLLLAALALLLAVPPGSACTIFYAFDGKLALGGNNEDYTDPDTRVWFVPGEGDQHGRVFFGFSNFFPQGGMNTAGLFYDGAATAELKMEKRAGRDECPRDVLDRMLATCADVDAAIAYLDRYDIPFMDRAMIFLGDRSGRSAIYEGDEVIRRDASDRYQVVTNFYQSRQSAGEAHCGRLPRAETAFASSFGKNHALSLSVMRDVIIATHQYDEKSKVATRYSNVYDLANGDVYVYRERDFDRALRFRLTTELEKGRRSLTVAELFAGDAPTTKPPLIGNAKCPKSGRPVIEDAFFESDGTRVNFCGHDCAREGAKEPKKWVRRVRAAR